MPELFIFYKLGTISSGNNFNNFVIATNYKMIGIS